MVVVTPSSCRVGRLQWRFAPRGPQVVPAPRKSRGARSPEHGETSPEPHVAQARAESAAEGAKGSSPRLRVPEAALTAARPPRVCGPDVAVPVRPEESTGDEEVRMWALEERHIQGQPGAGGVGGPSHSSSGEGQGKGSVGVAVPRVQLHEPRYAGDVPSGLCVHETSCGAGECRCPRKDAEDQGRPQGRAVGPQVSAAKGFGGATEAGSGGVLRLAPEQRRPPAGAAVARGERWHPRVGVASPRMGPFLSWHHLLARCAAACSSLVATGSRQRSCQF